MGYDKTTETETGARVPGWTPDFGARLASLISQLGGLKSAAPIAGITDEQLAKWRDGKAKPNYFALQAMCRKAERSLLWLEGSVGPKDRRAMAPITAQIDEDVLVELVCAVEDYLHQSEQSISAEAKGALLATLYNWAKNERAKELAFLPGMVEQLVGLVLKRG